MKTKNNYIKPKTEIIELEVKENTSVITGSNGSPEVDITDNPTNGIGRARRRNFWGNEEE